MPPHSLNQRLQLCRFLIHSLQAKNRSGCQGLSCSGMLQKLSRAGLTRQTRGEQGEKHWKSSTHQQPPSVNKQNFPSCPNKRVIPYLTNHAIDCLAGINWVEDHPCGNCNLNKHDLRRIIQHKCTVKGRTWLLNAALLCAHLFCNLQLILCANGVSSALGVYLNQRESVLFSAQRRPIIPCPLQFERIARIHDSCNPQAAPSGPNPLKHSSQHLSG